MAKRYLPLDVTTLFATALTITASDVIPAGQEGGFKIGKGRQDLWWVTDVIARDVASADELYRFLLQGCSVNTFTGQPIENLAMIEIGATAVRLGGAQTSPLGRYAVPISNEILQKFADFEFVRLNVLISGTTPSITFSSWLSEGIRT